jgi:DNA repair exonuclease SbcCD ATPase subunit
LYIHRLTASFGRLDNQRLVLGPGLNILKAPNETGKSTWCAFLSAMLYGISSRERDRAGSLADKNRYAPWNGQPMQGRMELCTAGREITLLRETRRPAAPMAEFSANYAGTGDAVPGLTGLNCGEALLGIPQSVFERSAFIRQSGLSVSQDAELEKRILSLISSGEEGSSYLEASAALKKQLNRRRHNKTGELPQMEDALAELDRRLTEMDALRSELEAVRREMAQTAALQTDCQRKIATILQQESLQKQCAFRNAQSRAAALRAQLGQDRIPENETIARLRGAIVNLETTRKAVNAAREKRDEAEKNLLRASAAADDGPFAGMTSEDARHESTVTPKVRASMLVPAIVSSALLVLSGVAGFVWKQPLLFGVGCVLTILICWRLCAAARKKARIAALVKRFGTADPAEISKQADTYCILYEVREKARADAAAAKAAADALYASLSSNEQAILLAVRRFAPAAFDIPAADAALRSCAVRRRELLDAERAVQEAALRQELMVQQTAGAGISPAADASAAKLPEERPDALHAQLEALRERSAALQSRADRLSGQLSAMGDPAALAREKEALTARHDACQQEYDALALALDTLEHANTALQGRFSPALGRRTAEIFSALTGGRYHAVTLDRAFRLAAEPSGDPIPRDAQFLSAGALDQLYLAVRLAICELVLPPEEPVPIILDDALTNFDDERCVLALQWLRREAAHRQILLFSCHSREAEFFRDDPEVCVQELTNPLARV